MILPSRLKLLNWGANETTKGVLRVGTRTARELAGNQVKRRFDHIALDFAHNSLPGHPNFQPDPRKIAAYGVPEVVAGDGLYLSEIQYTPTGLEFAAEYPELSPAPLLAPDGEVEFLHSVALCRQGSVRGLRFVSLSALVGETAALTPLSLRGGVASQTASHAEAAVRRALGISKELWDRHERP
jgi:hypothetical protein